MAGLDLFRKQLPVQYPHTYNALTKLVLAMSKVYKNSGKKTFFGRDKGQESYDNFLQSLKVTLQCMVLDEVIDESTPTDLLYDELGELLRKFSLAYPNWQDAYAFSTYFFVENKESAIAAMDRLR
jgi:hypothetical protein